METEESVQVDHFLARNIDAGAHRIVLRFAMRDHNIQTIGGAALENDNQPLVAEGTVTVGERSYPVRAGAHRDKSWGPRDWRIGFLIGDLQGEDRELYFVGAPAAPVPRMGGYLREGTGELVRLACVEGDVRFDDAHATVAPVHLVFETPTGERVEVDMTPVGPSVQFDMAHTCEVPEHWLYWRHLVEARVSTWASTWDTAARGWFEASRYGVT